MAAAAGAEGDSENAAPGVVGAAAFELERRTLRSGTVMGDPSGVVAPSPVSNIPSLAANVA